MLLPPVGLNSGTVPHHQTSGLKRRNVSNRTIRRVAVRATTTTTPDQTVGDAQLLPAQHSTLQSPPSHPVLLAMSGTRAWASQLWMGLRHQEGPSAVTDAAAKGRLMLDTAERAKEVISRFCDSAAQELFLHDVWEVHLAIQRTLAL